MHGVARDVSTDRTAPLYDLPGAESGLTLFSADMHVAGSFDTAMAGCDAVFIASLIPTYRGPSGTLAREMDDVQGEREIVMPTVDACLNILKSAKAHGIKDALICSSTSSTNPIEPVARKNEVDHWSDQAHQYAQKKYTSAAKTVMEPAAIDFCEHAGIRLSIFLPTLMLGPAVLPAHNDEGFQGMLKRMLEGGEARYEQVPNDSSSMIHVQDLASLFFAAYENPAASGRYFGVYDSWPLQAIFDELATLMPEANMPKRMTDTPAPPTGSISPDATASVSSCGMYPRSSRRPWRAFERLADRSDERQSYAVSIKAWPRSPGVSHHRLRDLLERHLSAVAQIPDDRCAIVVLSFREQRPAVVAPGQHPALDR